MSRSVRLYLVILLGVVLGWLWLRAPAIVGFRLREDWLSLIGIATIYLFSHLLRMLRLALLTLDERNKAFPLIAAHTLTAFPSSFLPFKIGELLRLGAFFCVYGGRRKAFAVWLTERFGDVLVIATFILGLYLFKVSVPDSMRTVFLLFVMASLVGLMGLFAVAKVFVYLNRHLVLTSHSRRGLFLLRASHILRRLELDIYQSVEGRLSGFLLLSLLIWGFEILALSLFRNHLATSELDFADLFASGLLASLPGGAEAGANVFGLYQSLALVALTLFFIGAVWLATRLRVTRS